MHLLRPVLLPLAISFSLLLLAWFQWSDFRKKATTAAEFHVRSEVVHFKDVAAGPDGNRAINTYQYDDHGVVREFSTHRNLILPPGGKARIGPDPSPDAPSPPPEIAVPLNGPDTVETIYQGMFRSLLPEDRSKPLVITLAALVAGVIGYFLQRQIARGVRPPGRRR
jgi:hypothetical protein